jgi:acyl-CoA synthetase (NDP forming)
MKAKSLAIVGISGSDPFGGQVYANLQLLGYEGKIYGVNPRYETLYDQKIYPSLSNLPETPDCAILALPNSRLLPVLEQASEIAASNDVPVVALKVGRSKRGAQLAQVSVLAQRGFDLDPSIGVWLRERRMTLVKALVEFA